MEMDYTSRNIQMNVSLQLYSNRSYHPTQKIRSISDCMTKKFYARGKLFAKWKFAIRWNGHSEFAWLHVYNEEPFGAKKYVYARFDLITRNKDGNKSRGTSSSAYHQDVFPLKCSSAECQCKGLGKFCRHYTNALKHSRLVEAMTVFKKTVHNPTDINGQPSPPQVSSSVILPAKLVFYAFEVDTLENLSRVPDLIPTWCKDSHADIMYHCLEEKTRSDFVIRVDGKEFPCNKCILAAHSPVFAQMFSSNMVETQSNEVDLQDTCEEVVDAFLRYIYYGDLEKVYSSSDLAFELLIFANKYQTKKLQGRCQMIIQNKADKDFSVLTALRIYLFASKCPEVHRDFSTKAIALCKSKVEELAALEEFRQLWTSSPNDAANLFKDVCKPRI